jgi:hypothetical protein
MTFSELSRIAARDGKLPPGRRPHASLIVRSAEGQPDRGLGIEVRAPKPITPAQAAWLRATRAAA